MSTVTVTINGQAIEVPAGITVLQACEMAGVEVPRFCYHERLNISGNCRMCLVEVKPGPPKPQASCALPVADKMEVFTESEMAKKARRGVMEFLLMNHPLDCPICDQGGECDLQDQAMYYGLDHGRYHDEKRSVADKNMGPLINMNTPRCIHCTRCVRFAQDVAGVPQIGMIGRGDHSEITTYVNEAIRSELSGNLVDICPVGSLTSLPYRFTARPWELRKVESIDVFDGLGANIRVDCRGNQVMRVQPRINDDVNEEWLGDKSRFSVDGLTRQRIDRPYVRKGTALQPASWGEALEVVAKKLSGTDATKIAAIAGDMADAEAMIALKDLMDGLGVTSLDCRQDGAKLDPKAKASWLFNSGVAGIDKADAILLVGTNPRWESPVLNARIRRRYINGGVPVAHIGPKVELTYKHENLGASASVLADLAEGKGAFFEVMKAAERPMIILGMGALTRDDAEALQAAAHKLAEAVGAVGGEWNGYNVLHTAASRVGGLELGFVPGEGGRDTKAILDGCAPEKGAVEVLYLLGADEVPMNAIGPKTFVIYQGTHGDQGAHRADVVLPGAAYTEKTASYINTEGRMQRTNLAVFPPGEAKEDWAILRALSEAMGKTLPYDTADQVRARLVEASPVFAAQDDMIAAEWGPFGKAGDVAADDFAYPIANYYMTDAISRTSPTMAECSRVYVGGSDDDQERTGNRWLRSGTHTSGR